METTSIDYNGFTITAAPRRIEDGELWTVDLTISRGSGAKRESWLISAGEQEELSEEALNYCFEFGKEVVDRELTS